VTIDHLRRVADELDRTTGGLDSAHQTARELPRSLVEAWQQSVLADIAARPFGEGELAVLGSSTSEQQSASRRLLAYGSTVLGLLATEQILLMLQLGDGDILCVDTDGMPNRPWQRDPRLIGNDTTSLCMPRAWEDMQLHLTPMEDRHPALVLMSTDGYANSFATPADFLQVGPDFLGLVRQHGLARLSLELETILAETSRDGSGDDTTLGLVWLAEPPAAESGSAVPDARWPRLVRRVVAWLSVRRGAKRNVGFWRRF
jgi:hypothetical protein